VIVVAGLLLAAACGGDSSSSSNGGAKTASSGPSVQIEDVKPGSGAQARKGDLVRVHYVAWLYDASQPGRRGRRIDSTRARNAPAAFRLGAGELIVGGEEGVLGMKVGATRILTIPPELAYGSRGAGALIPPDATLIFEVELLEIRSS
jgi:FKBP-type peptidyl-prolyl cis-trans isomerase FkpA